MNEFNHRWQEGSAAARQAPPAGMPSAPPGFATRVVARWRTGRETAPPLLFWWDLMSRRALACLAVALVITVAVSWPTDGHEGISQPPIEDAASELFLSL